jgi:beta-lactamase superfamily II metal-dependent hydrolase
MLSSAIDLSRTRVHALADTMSLHFGPQTLTIVHPDRNFIATDENNASLVCRFNDTMRRYLFTGVSRLRPKAISWSIILIF